MALAKGSLDRPPVVVAQPQRAPDRRLGGHQNYLLGKPRQLG